MRKLLVIILLIGINIANGQQITRLVKDWQFLKQDIGGVWEAVRAVKAGNPESLPIWRSVTLPHCFNAIDAVDPEVNYYQGPGWYRTQLKITNPYQKGRTLLHFEGAGQKTEVYIYTTKVGAHTGGYDEWTVDISDAIAAFRNNDSLLKQFNGKIPLSIRCDNSRDLEMIPSNLSDFNLYGGIYRYLNLVYVPPVSFDKLFVDAKVDSAGKLGLINVNARFYDPLSIHTSAINVRLLSPEGKIIQQVEKKITDLKHDTEIANFSISKPQLWSPESPSLYSVESVVTSGSGVYKQVEKFGFRNFEFIKNGPFKLNGERLLIRGTQRHEDGAGVAAALTEEIIREEFLSMKEMGVNFIRLGHYQNSRIALDLCDSLGIMVWEEIPWCRGGLGGEKYKQQAKRMLTNMITQHYNHPSVIIWGLGNENDWPGDFPEFDKEKIRSFMKELNSLSHKMDPSRKTAIRRCDFCKDIVDVYSPSIWAGWYRGIYTEYKQVTEEEFRKVDHFIHMEWGGDSHAGRHSENPDKALQGIKQSGSADERAGDASLFGGAARVSKDGDWSESYICNLFDWHLKEQETMPWLTGTAQWIFKDFSTPVRPDNPVPYMNQKGVLQRDLTKKESYYVFQSYWSAKPMAHIYGHTWPVRWGNEGEEKMIKVYSNCDEADLIVNGKSYGIKKRNSQDFPAAGLRWSIPLTRGIYQVSVVAKKGNIIVQDSISFTYQTEKWGKPARLLIEKVKQENDTMTLEAKLLDDKNVQCLDSANWIQFGLTGDGELIENQGTPQGSSYVQLYNGRAIISVITNKGNSVLSAKVAGVPTAFFNVSQL